MSTFSISGLTLLSDIEQKARAVSFHPKCTVLTGENQTGKSAIAKGIYLSLGADISHIHPTWQRLGVKYLLDFEVGGQSLTIVRVRKTFGLFTRAGALIEAFPSVSALAPMMARLLEFSLRLTGRGEGQNAAVPPPAYKLLPFYVDQEAGWSRPWSSFSNLGQFVNWQGDVASCHTGILPGAYYAARSELLTARAKETRLEEEAEALERVFRSREVEWQDAPVTLDPVVFRFEIERLEKRASKLRNEQARLRQKVFEQTTQVVGLQAQLQILDRVRAELGLDFEHAASLSHSVRCPTCAAEYSNQAADRFAIAADQTKAGELILGLDVRLEEAMGERARLSARLDALDEECATIATIMETKNEDVSLGQLIRSAGRDELRRSLREGFDASQIALEVQRGKVGTAEAEVEKFTDRFRKREIMGEMRSLLGSFYDALDVQGLDPSKLTNPQTPPKSTGSENPRALLAYAYAVIYTARRFAPEQLLCPLVIDSPNQQGQDDFRLEKVLRFVFDRTPEEMQLVVASERLPEEPNRDATIVELTDRYGLLRNDEYNGARDRMEPMLTLMNRQLEEIREAAEG